MMLPPVYSFVVPLPVAMLDLKPRRGSRAWRRKNRYGKLNRWDRMAGKMSPKQMRESGL